MTQPTAEAADFPATATIAGPIAVSGAWEEDPAAVAEFEQRTSTVE